MLGQRNLVTVAFLIYLSLFWRGSVVKESGLLKQSFKFLTQIWVLSEYDKCYIQMFYDHMAYNKKNCQIVNVNRLRISYTKLNICVSSHLNILKDWFLVLQAQKNINSALSFIIPLQGEGG